MTFEFDPNKSAANLAKHQIDFIRAQGLWLDPDGLTIPVKSRTETRDVLIAKLDGEIWAAVFTVRGESLRLISVRRAHEDEKIAYANLW